MHLFAQEPRLLTLAHPRRYFWDGVGDQARRLDFRTDQKRFLALPVVVPAGALCAVPASGGRIRT
jgi:hypothetical protein